MLQKDPIWYRILILPVFLVAATIYAIWCFIDAIADWIEAR